MLTGIAMAKHLITLRPRYHQYLNNRPWQLEHWKLKLLPLDWKGQQLQGMFSPVDGWLSLDSSNFCCLSCKSLYGYFNEKSHFVLSGTIQDKMRQVVKNKAQSISTLNVRDPPSSCDFPQSILQNSM